MGNVPLYKIGTGWVFDVNTGVGYSVRRETRTNVIQAFDVAFEIKGSGATTRVEYKMEVPSGVVRKAIHLMELSKTGKLKYLTDKFYSDKQRQ